MYFVLHWFVPFYRPYSEIEINILKSFLIFKSDNLTHFSNIVLTDLLLVITLQISLERYIYNKLLLYHILKH